MRFRPAQRVLLEIVDDLRREIRLSWDELPPFLRRDMAALRHAHGDDLSLADAIASLLMLWFLSLVYIVGAYVVIVGFFTGATVSLSREVFSLLAVGGLGLILLVWAILRRERIASVWHRILFGADDSRVGE